MFIGHFAAAFGPPPRDVGTLALTGVAGRLFVGWGYWIERRGETAAVPLAN